MSNTKSMSTVNKRHTGERSSLFTILTTLRRISKKISLIFKALNASKHGWYFVAFGLLSLYMLVFQSHFVLSGDIWAEAFPEYVNEAVTLHWIDVFLPSWAGYLTIIPSFLSKIYVTADLPLGYIDYYLRAVSLIFAIGCISFIAHPVNRRLIPSDLLRIGLAFIFLLSLRHVSVLSFINIWYAGFIVVALISLSGKRFSARNEWLYTLFATAVILSKSSLVLLPFVIYRALTTKRYIQGVLLLIAVVLQTYLTVFAVNGYGNDQLNANIVEIIRDLFLGASVLFYKLIHFPFVNHYTILVGSSILLGAAVIIWIRKGWLFASTIGLGLAIALYLHIFAPDNSFKNIWETYPRLYDDAFKLQREFFISFLLLLVGGIALSLSWSKSFTRYKYSKASALVLGALVILGMSPFNKIDLSSPALSADISPYRESLNEGESVCMPVPPTPLIDYHAAWFFQYKGGCYLNQPPEQFHLSSLHHQVTPAGTSFAIKTGPKEDLKTILLPVSKQPFVSSHLILFHEDSDKSFAARIPDSAASVVFISFNLEGTVSHDGIHNFTLKDPVRAEKIYTGNFESGAPLLYSYFIGRP